MSDKPNQPFVVTDRRRFTSEGDVRPDAPPVVPRPPRDDSPMVSSAEHAKEATTGPTLVPEPSTNRGASGLDPETRISTESSDDNDTQQPPPLTSAQLAEASSVYNATVARLDAAMQANNPGMDSVPAMSFERLVQSIYMQTLMQLGGVPDPNQDPSQPPRVDLLGARQSIDMLSVISDKTSGKLTDSEARLIEAALFEMRMGFLEITDHLSRQAAARQQQPPPPTAGGPSIVR